MLDKRHFCVFFADGSAITALTSAVSASTLDTWCSRKRTNAVFRNRYLARVPRARMGEAEEMVGALLYLASDASSYVTGRTSSSMAV
jgi:NAD(P)-dependent dehydrogenase (short-subunit alcohol dehydrogenase family)